MSCSGYKATIIEAARSRDDRRIRRHLDHCDACRALFEEQISLDEAMRPMRLDGGCDGLEAVLLNEFDAAWPAKRKSLRWLWLPVSVAAAIVLAFWMRPMPSAKGVANKPVAIVRPPAPVEIPKPAAVKPAQRHSSASKELQPFIPIPYTTPLAPYERAQVMQVEMPVAELIAAGLPISTSDPGAEARADVLVGDDGRARAVRVISIFQRSMER